MCGGEGEDYRIYCYIVCIELNFIEFLYILSHLIYFNLFPTLPDLCAELCVVSWPEWYWQEEVGGGGDSGVSGEGGATSSSYLHTPAPCPARVTDIRVICCTSQSSEGIISSLYHDDARHQVRDIIALKNISFVLPPEIYIDGEILVWEHWALGEYFIVYFSWK